MVGRPFIMASSFFFPHPLSPIRLNTLTTQMGIHANCFKLLKERIAPSAFREKSFSIQRDSVIEVDLTQWIRTLSYKNENKEMILLSGQELINKLKKKIRTYIQTENGDIVVKTLVICMDKSSPEQKRRTQLKRKLQAEKSGIKPYDKDTKLTIDGIINPSSAVSLSIEGEEELNLPEFIDVYRLALSSHLRYDLCELIHTEILTKEYFGCEIIFDYDPSGPRFYTEHIKGYLLSGNRNSIGESDRQLIYYASKFLKDTPVILDQTDGDLLPISLSYLLQNQRDRPSTDKNSNPIPGDLLWIKRSSSGISYIDLTQIYFCVSTYFPHLSKESNIQIFILWCILNGTDFVLKNQLSYFANYQDMYKALILSWEDIQPHILSSSSSSPKDPRCWMLYVRYLVYGNLNKKENLPMVIQASSHHSLKRKGKENENENKRTKNNNIIDLTKEQQEDPIVESTPPSSSSVSPLLPDYITLLNQARRIGTYNRGGTFHLPDPLDTKIWKDMDTDIVFNFQYWNWNSILKEENAV